MRYLKQSADVLNAADRFERILNWEIFAAEQEARLYGYDGTKSDPYWIPGVPLYKHPHTIPNWRMDETDAWDGLWGNTVRPMFQLLDMKTWARCEPCGVSWTYGDDCWICGESYPRIDRQSTHFDSRLMRYSMYDAILAVGRRDVERHIRLQIDVEIRQFAQAMFGTIREFDEIELLQSTPLYSFHNPIIEPTTVFERPNIRGTLWGTAALYNPRDHDEYSERVRVPFGWREMRRTVALPEFPEPKDYTDWQPSGHSSGPERRLRQ